MNVAAFFIRRPVATVLLMLGMLISGIVGYSKLPVNQLPNVDFPTIQVMADLDGADPETMASSVAMILERQFSTIAGVDSMTSISSPGRTRIIIQFALDRNIDAAAQDVQAAIGIAQRRLPTAMTMPPSYRKVNPADFPVLYLLVSSPTLPLYEVNEYADTMIAQRISMVPGVAQVLIFGQKKYAVRVQLDPNALATRQLGIDEVANAIAESNTKLPTGKLEGPDRASNIKASGQLENAAAFNEVIVAWRNGASVRLKELGQVIDSETQDKQLSWTNREPSIFLAIQRQPGTNTVEVVNNIKKLLPEFQQRLPAAVNLEIFYDRSETIRASVADVQFTLLLTVCLVVLVIFLFLRNLPATVIPSLALPLSIITTFGVMYLCGFSLDNLSLMGLTLAVGFVVDDAIVMFENIVRHQEMGKHPLVAAFEGSKEICFTIVSMTFSLVAVFIPVLFMSGIVGRLFFEFAVVISVAILISCVVSLTLTPMLCAYFLPKRPVHGPQYGGLYGGLERGFNSLRDVYARSLHWVLRHRRMTMLASLLLAAATGWLFYVIPKGFLPYEDEGFITGTTEATQSISFEGMKRAQQALDDILMENPAVERYNSLVGMAGPNVSANTGRLNIRLKPHNERQPIEQELARLRRELNSTPGLQVYLSIPPMINIGGRATKALYQYTLQSPHTEELYASAETVERALRALPMIQDVNSDLQLKNPEVHVEIDRAKAAALGVSPAQIELALQSAYGSREISTIFTATNDYRVYVQLLPQFQQDPSALSKLYVRSKDGVLVPLDALASLRMDVGPMAVNHSGQFPAVTLSYNLRPGVSLGDAVAAVERTARPLLAESVTAQSQGTAQAFQDSLSNMGILIVLAIVVIYLVLGMLYESFIHPLTILSGLPSAGFGALATLWLFGMDLNLYAFLGVIMLIGIVKKNAIMMLDFALAAQRKDASRDPLDAITEGCLVRFRPIMMTTMAALMGALPIAIGIGAGADARRPLGLAVVGGLCFSQIVTLYITPVYYYYLERLSGWLRARYAKNITKLDEEYAQRQ